MASLILDIDLSQNSNRNRIRIAANSHLPLRSQFVRPRKFCGGSHRQRLDIAIHLEAQQQVQETWSREAMDEFQERGAWDRFT
jgi:hypothetical protein